MIYLVYCKYITVIILQYNNTSMTFSFRVYKEILDLFEKNSLLWATQISQKLEISRPIIHKVLNHLLMEKKIEKVWIASHTRYKSLIFSWSNILNSNKVLWINSIKENSDDFVFDNQMLVQAIFFGFRIGEITCPALYHKDASSINFLRSIKYGLGVLLTGLQFILAKAKITTIAIFRSNTAWK